MANNEIQKTDPKDWTIKQRKWVSAYLETGSATEAALSVYDCNGDREVAATIGWENLRKLDFAELMEAGGITDKRLKEKLDEGLDANKPIGALVLIKNTKDGKEEVLKDNEGMIEVPDMPTRHKYLETALKLKRRLLDKMGGETGYPDIKFDLYGNTIITVNQPATETS